MTGEDWEGHKLYIMDALKRIECKVDNLSDKMDARQTEMERRQADLAGEVKVLKAQAALAGAVMGFIASFVVMIIKHYI